jgi:hypothetical protein
VQERDAARDEAAKGRMARVEAESELQKRVYALSKTMKRKSQLSVQEINVCTYALYMHVLRAHKPHRHLLLCICLMQELPEVRARLEVVDRESAQLHAQLEVSHRETAEAKARLSQLQVCIVCLYMWEHEHACAGG